MDLGGNRRHLLRRGRRRRRHRHRRGSGAAFFAAFAGRLCGNACCAAKAVFSTNNGIRVAARTSQTLARGDDLRRTTVPASRPYTRLDAG